jgi:hypothetical protein
MARNLKSNGPGHNSGGAIDGEQLKKRVAEAAELMTEQKKLGEDLKELCREADEAGVCSKSELRRRARESLMDPEILQSQLQRDADLRAALGWFAEEPLGKAAIQAQQPTRRPGRSRKSAADEALARAQAHIDGPSGTPNITAEREHASADPYAAGREAALHGFNESRNPFDPGSLIGDEWLDGFKAAQSEQSGQAPGNA